MPGRFELKPTLAKIWQAPDNFRIMDPLPPLHRRGIIIGPLVDGDDVHRYSSYFLGFNATKVK